MTPNTKKIASQLILGYFLRKQRRMGGKIVYVLFDARVNPITKVKPGFIKNIHRSVPEALEVFRYTKQGDIKFNLSVIRQLHGNHTLKRLYKDKESLLNYNIHPVKHKRKSTTNQLNNIIQLELI